MKRQPANMPVETCIVISDEVQASSQWSNLFQNVHDNNNNINNDDDDENEKIWKACDETTQTTMVCIKSTREINISKLRNWEDSV